MPAIRDFTTNYIAATSTTFTLDTPDYAQNDLLLAVICGDTNTSRYTWSASGWSLLCGRTSTSELVVLYKIAAASEPASFTFTRTAAETFNGSLISIRDVNTSAPFGSGIASTGLITVTVNAAAGTFTRSTGSFLTDGFQIGQTIMTNNFINAGNNTTKVISNVTATVITVSNTAGLVNETATANVFITSAVGSLINQNGTDRQTLPSITTTTANSLLLYAISNSSNAGSPEFIEGPVQHLYTVQGNSESSGAGWGFQANAGATPTVYSVTAASGSGVKLTLQIAPPSTGATVIPTYTAADASQYIDPLNGTTAFNGNTAFAATATTYFGTSLNGVTLANGTAAAIADQGLNPTNSTAALTTSAANNWSGATLVLAAANYPSVASKNILCHIGPSTNLQYQRLKAAISTRGVAIGMYSSAGNYRTWHVFGAGTAYKSSRDVPVIINAANTTGRIQNTGTLNTSSVSVFGFFLASQSTTAQYMFYSLWVLDTLTIGGGIAQEPVDIVGIADAVYGHNHRGVTIQGANQLLVLMPLQFGDGGAHPIYLDLNATAIEFPEQYNRTRKKTTYCSIDNVAGITYYAGASDTIKHRNSVISSASKYHWRFHASSSVTATYDFSGLQVIGAGTITLINGLPLTGVSWSSCDGFNSAGAYLDGCLIENSTSTVALTVTSTTNMSRITNSIFSENNNAGTTAHSLQLSATGTYTFDNLTFSGGGPAARSFHTTTGVNSATDVVTLDANHGYTTGSAIYYQKHGGTANIGLTTSTLYYVRAIAANQLAFYTSAANAIADTSRINLTASGTETHYIYSALADVYNSSSGTITINIQNGGNIPSIRNAETAFTIVNFNVNLTITVQDEGTNPISGAQVAVYKTSDNSTIIAPTTTNASGVVTGSAAAGTGAIYIRVRQSNTTDSPRYYPTSTVGTIGTSDFSVTITMIQDTTVT